MANAVHFPTFIDGLMAAEVILSVTNPGATFFDIINSGGLLGQMLANNDGTNVTNLVFTDTGGNTVLTVTGLSVSVEDFEDGLKIDTPDEGDPEFSYPYLVSLFDGDVTVTGSTGGDQIEIGAGGTATVDGHGGDDTVFVWHDKNIDFDGGDGSDTLAFDHQQGSQPGPASGAVIDLTLLTGTNPYGSGTLTLTDVENIIGVFGKDNNLRGNGDANFLRGGIRVDQLRGEGGNDTIYVKYWELATARAMLADGGPDSDTLVAEISNSAFIGSGFDIIFINTLDLLDPGQNTGTFNGGTFTNFEVFQASADLIYQRFDFRGSNSGEVASGDIGPDILSGRGGNDTLSGFGREDSLDGGAGDDTLFGGAGIDALNGGTGADMMKGGADSDTYIVDNAGDVVDETGGNGTDSVFASVSFGLAGGVENLTLTGGAVAGTGSGIGNLLTGNGLANTLDGQGGADLMRGLGGNDTYVVDNAGDVVDENATAANFRAGPFGGRDAADGSDTVLSFIDFSLADGAHVLGAIENLTLLGGAVAGTGNALANAITGNGVGNVLNGLGANDTLTGGGGADWFLFATAIDKNPSVNLDHITDFVHLTDDIVLSKAIFPKLKVGDLKKGAFFAGKKAKMEDDDRLIYNKKTGDLAYDKDGDGHAKAIVFAVLDGSPDKLSAKDFLVVA